MKKQTKLKGIYDWNVPNEKLKADSLLDIVPDAEMIAQKYSERQIDLLFAFVKCIKAGVLK